MGINTGKCYRGRGLSKLFTRRPCFSRCCRCNSFHVPRNNFFFGNELLRKDGLFSYVAGLLYRSETCSPCLMHIFDASSSSLLSFNRGRDGAGLSFPRESKAISGSFMRIRFLFLLDFSRGGSAADYLFQSQVRIFLAEYKMIILYIFLSRKIGFYPFVVSSAPYGIIIHKILWVLPPHTNSGNFINFTAAYLSTI